MGQIAIYVFGERQVVRQFEQCTPIVEIVLPDGRTVQCSISKEGQVFLRGWGNVPGKTINVDQMQFLAQLNPEPVTHCESCCNPLPCSCEVTP